MEHSTGSSADCNDRDYYSRYSLGGDLFPVHADSEYADEIADRYAETTPIERDGKKPCPFLSGTSLARDLSVVFIPPGPPYAVSSGVTG